MNTPHLTLTILAESLAVCRLAHDAPLPAWAAHGRLISITRTPDELSIVCEQAHVPEGITCEPGWRCLQVAGPLDFALVGVLAALVTPLAAAEISIFALSTFDTDYLLVKADVVEQAIAVLVAAGHTVQG
jgi:hypothetical protein